MTKSKASIFTSLAKSVNKLPQPANPLHGTRRAVPPLPENIICFQRRSGAELNRPHQGRALHHRHVLIVPLRGRAVVCADDRRIPLGPGDGLVILPYQHHHYTQTRGRLHWLFITFEYAQGVMLEPLRNLVFSVKADMAAQLDDLLRAQRDPNDSGLPELRLALLLARLAPPPGRGGGSGNADPAGALVLQVNHAAQARRPAAPTVRELAAELGMSPGHLRTRFLASCGISLGRHMRILRLERACGLLRMSSARISEIGEQCGFASPYSFSRSFRAHYGMSPKAYRKQSHDTDPAAPVESKGTNARGAR